jgi:putative radical SAM enzyme (TIGR03279 family)
VEPRSLGAKVGLRPGDQLLALNDRPVRDVIDVQVYAAEPLLSFTIEREGAELHLSAERQYGQPLGLSFAEELFDGPLHVCRNRCDFCFVQQMAPHLRTSLYVRDDDYRLSFLHGNYITLTNLTPEDWQRIEEQYLSPLYVSVHTTEAELRRQLLHHPEAGAILEQLARLVEMGIELHTQAVLVPRRNDGEHLDRTIADLADLHPGVRSLSVVPVGLTRRHGPEVRPYTDEESAAVLEQVLAWQRKLRQSLDEPFVYPSDEWYLRARRPTPAPEAYGELLPALVENGVGMLSLFAAGWPATARSLASLGEGKQTWVTGTLFAPVLRGYAARFAEEQGREVEVVAVPNRLFGETVTVAGLLAVEDILAALEGHNPGEVLVLSEAIFRGPEGQSLDERTPADLARATGSRVHLVR